MNMAKGGGGALVDWPAQAVGGFTTAMRYDVLRSEDPANFSTAVCIESDNSIDTMALDAQDPPVGALYFYLVRAEDDCPDGQGSLGSDSTGTPRFGRDCP